MQPRRRKPVNHALEALMRRALETSRISIEDLGRNTGLGRQVVGRIVRGETRRIAPDQVKRLVAHLPITTEQVLAACGYEMSASPVKRLPPPLLEALAVLEPNELAMILQAARGYAALRRETGVQS